MQINNDQKIYVIPCNGGFSCLGFDYAFNKASAIAKELNRLDLIPDENKKGTEAGYLQYMRAIDMARNSGKKLQCGLTKQLVGLEGKRVEVVTMYNETRRFRVGKSNGFIPCHLEMIGKSLGGRSAETKYKSVTILRR